MLLLIIKFIKSSFIFVSIKKREGEKKREREREHGILSQTIKHRQTFI